MHKKTVQGDREASVFFFSEDDAKLETSLYYRIHLQCRRPWFDSWVGKICWRRGYPLQYSWTSLVAQLVKNPPAMRETWVCSLGWEVPLEQGMATHSSILAWRIPWTIYIHGIAKSWTQLKNFHTCTYRAYNVLQC